MKVMIENQVLKLEQERAYFGVLFHEGPPRTQMLIQPEHDSDADPVVSDGDCVFWANVVAEEAFINRYPGTKYILLGNAWFPVQKFVEPPNLTCEPHMWQTEAHCEDCTQFCTSHHEKLA